VWTKAAAGTIVILVIAGVAAWHYWPAPTQAHAELTLADPSAPLSETIPTSTVREADYLPRPLTMRDLFDTDFTAEANGFGPALRAQAFGAQITLHNGQTAENYDVPVKIVYAIERNTRFVAYFVPKAYDALNIAKALSADPEGPLKIFDQHAAVGAPGPADTAPKGIKGAPFSRLVIFYFEQDPALQQLEQIKSLFQDKSITVEFHGQEYLFAHRRERRLRQQTRKLGGIP
jgi:hypothetical protein